MELVALFALINLLQYFQYSKFEIRTITKNVKTASKSQTFKNS